MVFLALFSSRAAIYTLAFLDERTCRAHRSTCGHYLPSWRTRATSLPIPLLLPVTITVLPVWSGTSFEVQSGLGGKDWDRMLMRDSDIVK